MSLAALLALNGDKLGLRGHVRQHVENSPHFPFFMKVGIVALFGETDGVLLLVQDAALAIHRPKSRWKIRSCKSESTFK